MAVVFFFWVVLFLNSNTTDEVLHWSQWVIYEQKNMIRLSILNYFENQACTHIISSMLMHTDTYACMCTHTHTHTHTCTHTTHTHAHTDSHTNTHTHTDSHTHTHPFYYEGIQNKPRRNCVWKLRVYQKRPVVVQPHGNTHYLTERLWLSSCKSCMSLLHMQITELGNPTAQHHATQV